MRLTRLLRIAAASNPADMAKSLYSIAKNNEGYFKSEKQGMFLLKELAGIGRFNLPNPEFKMAAQWAKKVGKTDPQTSFAGVLKYRMEGFGVRDISKIRIAVLFYIVDSSGVVVLAKGKVVHPKQNMTDLASYEIIPSSIQSTFTRKDEAEPPIVVPYFAKVKQEENRRQKQIQENKTVIDKIKSIPGYDEQEILLSFLQQLEAGHTLSPKQMFVVNKYLDPRQQEDLGLDSPAEWKKMLESFLDHIEKQIIPPIKDRLKDTNAEEEITRVENEWKAFKSNPSGGEYNWTASHLIGNILMKLAPGRDIVVVSMDPGAAVSNVQQAIALPPNKKMLKKMVNSITGIKRLVSVLGQRPANKIKSAIEELLQA